MFFSCLLCSYPFSPSGLKSRKRFGKKLANFLFLFSLIFSFFQMNESWMLLSHHQGSEEEAADISLFLENEEFDPSLFSENQVANDNYELVDIELGASEKATMLASSVEMVEDYTKSGDEIPLRVKEQPKYEMIKPPPTTRDQLAVKISTSEDRKKLVFSTKSNENEGNDSKELKELKKQVEELSEKLNKFQDLEKQMDLLKSVIIDSSIHIDKSAILSNSNASSDAVALPQQTMTFVGGAPPPPPPPPPAADSEEAPKPNWRTAKAVKKEVTDADIENIVRTEIGLSEITDITKKTAIPNFFKAFSKPEHKILLRRIATDYPFLIRAFPLKPLECVKKFLGWEKHLFKGMNPEEAAAMRKDKQFIICKVETDQIESEIKKMLETEKKRKEAEALALEASKLKGNIVGELKEKHDQLKQKEDEAKAKAELESLQDLDQQNLDDLDITL